MCVPPPGGSVSAFTGWADRLPVAEVGVVQLPGRVGRPSEPRIESMSDAADGVADGTARLPAYPTVLFGHSLGALLAFETARRLRDRSWPLLALFVSGCRAPALPTTERPLAGLPTDELIGEACRRYQAIPEAVLADRELMPLLVPGLRADIAMAESYDHDAGVPLDCPIVACGGSTDPRASRPELEAWRSETRGRASVHLFGGGHMYLLQEGVALTGLIANQLSVMLGAVARGKGIR